MAVTSPAPPASAKRSAQSWRRWFFGIFPHTHMLPATPVIKNSARPDKPLHAGRVVPAMTGPGHIDFFFSGAPRDSHGILRPNRREQSCWVLWNLTRMYELTERHGAGDEGKPWTPPSVSLKEAPTHVHHVRSRQRQASRSRDSGHRRRRREGERRSQSRRKSRSRERRSRSRERRSRSRERRSRSRERRSRSRERRSRRETAEAVRASPDLSPKLPPGVPQAASTHSERDAWLGVLTQAVSRAVGVSPPSLGAPAAPAAPPSYQASAVVSHVGVPPAAQASVVSNQ
eukprot:s1056_g2.t2